MATVTIIVPSYNHARFLSACLDSVLAQTFTDWELLLVDDGSTDDSVTVARLYAAQDSRIRVEVNASNLGTYGTQQKCLDLTASEFVAVLNSDDLWEPEKLARQVAALRANQDAALCYTLGWKVGADGVPDTSEDVHNGWPRDAVQNPLPFLLQENRILASSVLFRREGLRFGPTCRYSGDHVALLEASWRGPFVLVPERLTFWRMHDSNSFVLSEGQMLEEIRLREAILRSANTWRAARPRSQEIESSLILNAQHLFAAYAFFGFRERLGALVPFLARSPAGLKRLASALLPREKLRQRLWGTQSPLDFSAAAEKIRALPPLNLKMAASQGATVKEP